MKIKIEETQFGLRYANEEKTPWLMPVQIPGAQPTLQEEQMRGTAVSFHTETCDPASLHLAVICI